MPGTIYVTENHLTDICTELLQALQVPSDHAVRAARILVEADLRGVSSHGVRLLTWNIDRIVGGGVNPRANVREISNAGAVVILDGDAGLGMTVGSLAMSRAIELAREQGIGWVMVRNSNHYGASGSFALMAVEQNMIGISISNCGPMMSIEGTEDRVIGNNPVAFGIPTPEYPMVLDMATSVASIGKIGMTRRAGIEVPAEWLVKERDDSGKMVLRHFGGAKGSGFAIMMEALTGALAGGAVLSDIRFDRDRIEPQGAVHTQIAIDPSRILPDGEFAERAKHMVDELHTARPAPSFEEVLLPGERAWRETLRRRRDGIPMEPDAVERLEEAGTKIGVDIHWT
jgi:L-2-hydroxycarboxylate dehydrogenase (NAD+)